jgi:hypothetical protein
VWRQLPVIQSLRRLRKEDHNLEADLVYRANSRQANLRYYLRKQKIIYMCQIYKGIYIYSVIVVKTHFD